LSVVVFHSKLRNGNKNITETSAVFSTFTGNGKTAGLNGLVFELPYARKPAHVTQFYAYRQHNDSDSLLIGEISSVTALDLANA